ncbi:MAG: ribosomal L7Ae/L30e/S12e/Gadd45 family protein [Parasporobacterium sp.]|nr:ribosomal L7Ae/L30e/S12e/Gadd45 family protein [Parasporobacterium sp.]
MNDKVLSFLSICRKAGKCVSGEFSCEKALKEGKAVMLIVAEDASANTKKHFTDMCTYRNVPIYFHGTKEALGACLGQNIRAQAAVLDEGFAARLTELLKNTDQK